MVVITQEDAAQRVDELLDRASAGEVFVITKDGKPIATMQAAPPEIEDALQAASVG